MLIFWSSTAFLIESFSSVVSQLPGISLPMLCGPTVGSAQTSVLLALQELEQSSPLPR